MACALVAVSLLTGCSSGGDKTGGGGTRPTATASRTAGPDGTAPGATGSVGSGGGPSTPGGNPSTGTPSTGTPGTGGTTRTPGLRRCHTSDLTGYVEMLGAAMGNRYAVLGLTNKSGTACLVYGFPGLEMVDTNGGTIRTQAIREPVTPQMLTVQPGQTVWAGLHWAAVPAQDEDPGCNPPSAVLRVIPPDETTQLTMSFQANVCQHGRIDVRPFSTQRLPT